MKRLILPFLILGLCACSNTPAPSPLDGVNKKLDNICQKLDEEKVSKEAKDAFYEYLSEISLSRDPYTIITVSLERLKLRLSITNILLLTSITLSDMSFIDNTYSLGIQLT